MRNIFLWASLPLVLSACQMAPIDSAKTQEPSGTSFYTMQVSPQSFSENAAVSGKVVLPITHDKQQYWLMTSEQKGLLLTDKNGVTLAQYPGNFEALDRRADIVIANKKWDMLATVDNESGAALLIGLDWQNQAFKLLTTITHNSSIEALCLQTLPHQPDSTPNVAVIIADDQGKLTQRIMVDGQYKSLSNVLLREFVGVPQVKDCAVDDASQSLYLAEENIGIWRYAAEPEAELVRELVAVSGVHGQLKGEVTSVDTLTDGRLLVVTPQQHGVWYIDPKQVNEAQLIALKGTLGVESVHGLSTKQGLLVGLFDDGTGVYQQAVLPITEAIQGPVSPRFNAVLATVQTEAVATSGDAADDPAIWHNAQAPELSRILGTNKKRGLNVYSLKGELLQSLAVGRVNNVDVRHGFTLAGKTFDIAAASNRSKRSISLFAIEPHSGEVSYLQDVATDLNDVYGLCMAQVNNQYYVFINDTDGHFEQYQLEGKGSQIKGKLVRQFKVASQPEGCVVDDEYAQLYFGEEAKGIWQVDATVSKALPRLIAPLNDDFVADVEGMGIYHLDQKRYLVASSQGNNSYGVFALDDRNRYLGSFTIDMNLPANIDGVSETDGLEISSLSFGDAFPNGLMVAQDGRNVMPSLNQNFKLVDATQIAQIIRNWL